MSKKTEEKHSFTISEELVPLLAGMESQNWSTNISKNNVKTITVSFKAKRQMTTVTTK